MKNEQERSVLSMGAIYLDTNAMNPTFGGLVRPNSEVVHGGYELEPGGSALIFARAAVAQGMRVHFIGKTGTDEMGNILLGKLQNEGIVPQIIQDSNVQTNINTNIVGINGDTFYQSFGNANQALSAKEIWNKFEEVEDEIDFLYLGGLYKLSALLPAFPALVSKAKKRQIKVIIDHGRVPQETDEERKQKRREDKNRIQQLVRMSDIYLPSIDELLNTWDIDSYDKVFSRLGRVAAFPFLPSGFTIAIKQGKEGAMGAVRAVGEARFEPHVNLVSIPSYPVPVLSTIGAGDTFNAAFIKSLSVGSNIEESVRYANAAAAFRISTNKFPTQKEVEGFLAKYS